MEKDGTIIYGTLGDGMSSYNNMLIEREMSKNVSAIVSDPKNEKVKKRGGKLYQVRYLK